MSQHTAQIIYRDFIEVFDVGIKQKNVDAKLLEVSRSRKNDESILTLDLAQNIREDYSIFPFESGDLTLIQIGNIFIVSVNEGKDNFWMKFTAQHIIEYLLQNPFLNNLFPYLSEDKGVLLNCALSDLIRTDYSYSELNKKVKFVKVALLMHFIHSNLEGRKFSRVVLDETVLGDIEIEHTAIAFRYLNHDFLGLIKINNIIKIISLLKKEKIIDTQIKFVEDAFFINNLNNSEKVKLVFKESGAKFDYHVAPHQNYVFDLDNKEFTIEIMGKYQKNVHGKVFVFNGDERDLLIN